MRQRWMRLIIVFLGLGLVATVALADDLTRRPADTAPQAKTPRYDQRLDVDFYGTNAREYEFEFDERDTVVCPRCGRVTLHERIHDRLTTYHLYLANYLTHPGYGRERQVGFSRGESFHPVDLREEGSGRYSYRIRGLIDGDRELLTKVPATSRDCEPDRPEPAPVGRLRFYICIPENPDDPAITSEEWYDYTPAKFRRQHPKLRVRPPLGVVVAPRPEYPPTYPDYEALYRDGRLRIAFVFGFDEDDHNSRDDAIAVWKFLTAAPSERFRKEKGEPRSYEGPGLGFSNPIGNDFRKLNSGGRWTTFARNGREDTVKVPVRYRLRTALTVDGVNVADDEVRLGGRAVSRGARIPAGQVIERAITVEIRLLNFDRRGTQTAEQIRRSFMELFRWAQVIHYDGHANYGGGFLFGRRNDDVLWADELAKYRRYAPPFYQILSVGACHGAGYFADLFYNAFRGRKSTQNLDIIASVNEVEFSDSVDDMMDLLGLVLQIRSAPPRGPADPEESRPMGWHDFLLRMNDKRHFTAFIGVFGARDNPPDF